MTTTTRLPTTVAAPDWYTQASCKGLDTDDFFADRAADQHYAQSVCQNCPARLSCLDDTLKFEDTSYMRWGVSGGLTTLQRRALHCEKLLGNRPNLRQAAVLALPIWAGLLEEMAKTCAPAGIVVELRKHQVLVSPVTVRLALWWTGSKASPLLPKQPGDTRKLAERVRDEARDIVGRLRELGASNRSIAAYLEVSEDILGKAVTAWNAADAAALVEVQAA